jgi:membrane-associated phospholipid phosphatase
MKLSVSWTKFARELPCVLILFSFLTALLTWEPDALVLAGLMAVVLLVVAVLKRVLRHSRPIRKGNVRFVKDDGVVGVGFHAGEDRYGMPSGHATVAFAFFTYALFWLLMRRKDAMMQWQRVLGYAVSVPLFVLAPLLVAFQRVYDRHHSVPQVVVGAAVGIGLGAAAGLWRANV